LVLFSPYDRPHVEGWIEPLARFYDPIHIALYIWIVASRFKPIPRARRHSFAEISYFNENARRRPTLAFKFHYRIARHAKIIVVRWHEYDPVVFLTVCAKAALMHDAIP
jgi:hypothetical protein